MPKLTKRLVDAAEAREKPRFIWCSDLPGFGAKIATRGKVYYIDYRNRSGGRKRIAIGPHGKITTEEARKLALAMLGDVVKGGDPALERATRRASLTVAALCDRYFEAADRGLIIGKGGQPKKASTLLTDKGRAHRHIKPLLGEKLVIDLVQADLNRFIREVSSGKTAVVEKTRKPRGKAIVEGGAGTATRTMGLLGGILSFAVSEGVIAASPARGVRRAADKRRDRRLLPEEYRALGHALEQAAADREAWQGIAGARLLLLTGCRRSEIAGLKWADVDLIGHALRLSDSKEGRSIRPLGRVVVALLSKLPRETEFVLPASRGKGSFGGLPGTIERLTKRAGLVGVTAHTFRHSFASNAGDLGFSELTIGAMIGHSANSVTARYVHHLDSVLLAAVDRVADVINEHLAKTASLD